MQVTWERTAQQFFDLRNLYDVQVEDVKNTSEFFEIDQMSKANCERRRTHHSSSNYYTKKGRFPAAENRVLRSAYFFTPTPVLSDVPGASGRLTIFTASSASFVLPRFRRAIALLYQTKELMGLKARARSK